MFISRTHATIHGSTVHTSPSVTHTHTMSSPSDTGALSGHSFNGTPINTYAFVPLTSGHALPSHTNERAHIERQSTAADRPARVRNNIAKSSSKPHAATPTSVALHAPPAKLYKKHRSSLAAISIISNHLRSEAHRRAIHTVRTHTYDTVCRCLRSTYCELHGRSTAHRHGSLTKSRTVVLVEYSTGAPGESRCVCVS